MLHNVKCDTDKNHDVFPVKPRPGIPYMFMDVRQATEQLTR